jgi:hypothetical protein
VTPVESAPSSVFGFLKEVVRHQLGGESEIIVQAPDQLDCSMTYVNIPWQSIISDLLE